MACGRRVNGSICPKKKTWHMKPQLMSKMPNSVTPQQMCRLLYWFSQRIPAEQLVAYTGIPPKSLTKCVKVLRETLKDIMIEDSKYGEKLGAAPNTAVCLDEIFITKKKKNRGGFRGRTTRGHQTVIFAGTEIDLDTRRATGRTFCVVVPNRRRETLEPVIRARVALGATVWTDGHMSYKWMGHRKSGYTWDCVNHARGEFARDGVFTNAIEGLFSKLKNFFAWCVSPRLLVAAITSAWASFFGEKIIFPSELWDL